MSPKNTHLPSRRRQQGNGLVGLLTGLVLATLIIIAVLLVLNSNSSRDFKGNDPKLSQGQAGQTQPAVQQPASPVVTDNAAVQDGAVAPDANGQTAQDNGMTAPQQTASADVPPAVADNNAVEQNADNAQTAVKPTEEATAPAPAAKTENDSTPAVAPPPVVRRPDSPARSNLSGGSKAQSSNTGNASSSGSRAHVRPAPQPVWRESTSAFPKNGPAVTAKKPAPAPRPKAQAPARQPSLVDSQGNFQEHQSTRAKTPPKQAAKPQKPQQAAKAKQPESGKVTPDMILEYGSLEKARAEAARRAKAKTAPAPKKAQAQSKPVTPPAASSSKGNVVLQAGSYINAKAADAQRANLAMMGVQTKIVEAKVNGKSVYRVQTQGMNGNKAAQTKETLQKNGVSVYQRSE